MAFLNLFVGSECKIRIKNGQLVLKNDVKQEDFPVEDINAVIIENLQTNVSLYTLSFLAKNNVAVFVCDEQHLPCGYFLPFNSHYNQTKMFKIQTDLPQPLKKQLWQEIVRHKIANQNACLLLCRRRGVLEDLIKQVKSHDNTNVEAVAANKYFKMLFDAKFSREKECDINSALNYGYSILRGVIARNIVAHGLLPFLGLKHSNVFNNFNLADDLIEVFRPFVDLFVYQNSEMPFDTNYKMKLLNLLNYDCKIANGNYTISYAIEIFVQSFVETMKVKENKLKFPELVELKMHSYE